MTNRDQSEKLEERIAEVFALYSTITFRRYWELYKQTAEISEVQGLFVHANPEESYYNVAMIGDGRLVDVEGDDSDNSGGLIIRALDLVSGITFRTRPLEGFPRTQGASLVLLTKLLGETNPGPYWVARNPVEEGRLLGFARSLVQAFPSSRPSED